MASFDFGQQIKVVRMISPVADDGDGAIESETVDLAGYEGVAVAFSVGTVTTAAANIIFYESADTPVTVADGNKVASDNLIVTPTMDANNNKVYQFSLRPTKRYLRAVIPDRSSDAIVTCVDAILGYPVKKPT